MLYEYNCPVCCGEPIDVIKPVSEFDRSEPCPKCSTEMIRAFAPRKIHLYGTQVSERKWQPAFGKAMTDKEARAEAKRQNMIEVGNERPERHLKVPETEYPSFSDDDIRALTAKP